LVAWVQDFTVLDGKQVLVEDELAFFVQDQDDNVWLLGEYPEEFESGEFVGAPSTWISGVEDAQGGILVLGQHRPGTEYLQGLVPSVEFFDCGLVHQALDQVVVARERDPFDPEGGSQQKYYAAGVGLIGVDAVDDPEGETLESVERVRLGLGGLATARQNVKRLESRAYNSDDARVRSVYGQTDPAQQLPADDGELNGGRKRA